MIYKSPITFEDSYTKVGFGDQNKIAPHLHYHAEIVIALKGGFGVTVDGEYYEVNEGSAVIVFPYQLHEYFAIDSVLAAKMLMSPGCDTRLLEFFTEKLPISSLVGSDVIDSEIIYAANQMHEHYKYMTDFRGKLVETYMELIFTLVLERIKLTDNEAAVNIDTLHRIMHWINAHFTEPITVSDAAAELLLSESHISHLLAKKLHIGFRDYLNLLRVQSAAERLNSTQTPISEIALDCGFGSFASFNRIFKDTTGTTPREYRQKGAKRI